MYYYVQKSDSPNSLKKGIAIRLVSRASHLKGKFTDTFCGRTECSRADDSLMRPIHTHTHTHTDYYHVKTLSRLTEARVLLDWFVPVQWLCPRVASRERKTAISEEDEPLQRPHRSPRRTVSLAALHRTPPSVRYKNVDTHYYCYI